MNTLEFPNTTKTLRQRLGEGRIPVQDGLRYASLLAEALRKVHDDGRVHGSVTPDAIALTADGLELLPPVPGTVRVTVYTAPEVAIGSAPADASLPGRSFFALLKDGEAGEGERLLVWAPGTGAAQHGVTVPAASLVISDGKYWCYVERTAGVYVRREVTTDRPLGADYFVTQGIAAGDRIVIAGAGLLLAREMNPGTEAD